MSEAVYCAMIFELKEASEGQLYPVLAVHMLCLAAHSVYSSRFQIWVMVEKVYTIHSLRYHNSVRV